MNFLEEVEAVSNVGVVPNPSYNLTVSQLEYPIPGPSNSQNITVGIETTPQSPGNPINLDIADPITKIKGTFVNHNKLMFCSKYIPILGFEIFNFCWKCSSYLATVITRYL